MYIPVSSSWPWVASKIITTSNSMNIIVVITTANIFAPFDTVISRQNVKKDSGKMQQRPAILCTNSMNHLTMCISHLSITRKIRQ